MSCEITTKIAKAVKRIKYGLLNKIVERNINEYKVHAIRERIIAVIKSQLNVCQAFLLSRF